MFYLFEPLEGVVRPYKQRQLFRGLLSCTPRRHWGFLKRNRQSGCQELQGHEPLFRRCVEAQNFTETCLRYSTVAAKLIRLRSIEGVGSSVVEEDNVFIVHR